MSLVGRLASAIEPLLNGALALDTAARARVDRLDGAVLAVHVTGFEHALHVVPGAGRLHITENHEGTPAATLAGPPASLARLATRGGTQALFSGALQVSGDVRVAKAYKRLFDTLDPDWEEALARALGDIPAHALANRLRRAGTRGRGLGADRVSDLRAWLVDEVEALPARTEWRDWLAAVDRLRADSDRLQARLDRLERTRHGADS